MNDVSRKEAVNELWQRGILDFLLHDGQKKIKEIFEKDDRDIVTILCSRRFGKSFLLVILSICICIQKKNAIVKYICPKLKMVKTIIQPIMREILKTCPRNLHPEWRENDKIYRFPNGSEIQLAGTDNQSHESLRGGKSDLCIVDEAGFCDELNYVINSILAPTTDTTNGKIYLASTPSKESNHEFVQDFVKPAYSEDRLIKFTIHDNPMMTPTKIKRIIARYPLGEQSAQFRREYLCEIINDSEDIVIPEWIEEIQKECVREWDRPPFFDIYVSSDVGFRDLTVVLFGYYDFINAKLVVEDELVINGPEMTTDRLAKEIKIKEEMLYQDAVTKEPLSPYLRVMDNNLILINDLVRLHNLFFQPTAKDDKEAAINRTRIMIGNRQIIINPKCKTLIYHIKNSIWDKNRKTFKRMPNIANHTILGGHADALDALIYMVRNVDVNKNPYPYDWNMLKGDNVFYSRNGPIGPNEVKDSGLKHTLKKLMNLTT